jgi:hypothetical protein
MTDTKLSATTAATGNETATEAETVIGIESVGTVAETRCAERMGIES